MDEHFNGLSASEDERLAVLIEECAEVIKAATKVQRHGYDSYNPDDLAAGSNNEQLARECGDLLAALERMFVARDLSKTSVQIAKAVKLANTHRYLHHQPLAAAEKGEG